MGIRIKVVHWTQDLAITCQSICGLIGNLCKRKEVEKGSHGARPSRPLSQAASIRKIWKWYLKGKFSRVFNSWCELNFYVHMMSGRTQRQVQEKSRAFLFTFHCQWGSGDVKPKFEFIEVDLVAVNDKPIFDFEVYM